MQTASLPAADRNASSSARNRISGAFSPRYASTAGRSRASLGASCVMRSVTPASRAYFVKPFSGLTQAVSADSGAKEVYACASHGVLSGPAIERIENSCIKELLLLDTIPYPENAQPCDKIKYMSVAPVFAEAIQRVYEEISISNLFE